MAKVVIRFYRVVQLHKSC